MSKPKTMMIDDEKLTAGKTALAEIISSKKVGQIVKLQVWRDGKRQTVEVKLESQNGE